MSAEAVMAGGSPKPGPARNARADGDEFVQAARRASWLAKAQFTFALVIAATFSVPLFVALCQDVGVQDSNVLIAFLTKSQYASSALLAPLLFYFMLPITWNTLGLIITLILIGLGGGAVFIVYQSGINFSQPIFGLIQRLSRHGAASFSTALALAVAAIVVQAIVNSIASWACRRK